MGSFQERYNDPNICLVRLRSPGTERIFDQLKNLTGEFVHWHGTVRHFRSVNTEP